MQPDGRLRLASVAERRIRAGSDEDRQPQIIPRGQQRMVAGDQFLGNVAELGAIDARL